MKKQNIKKIYRASVRVRFKFELFRDTYCFLDRTLFRDFSYDPRGLVTGFESWLFNIRKYESFYKILTSPEVEEIEVNEQ